MITENPTFSFIIPSYNSESAYLFEAVSSCLATNYDNIEIIVVDDGSDNKRIYEELTSLDHRIKVFTKENGGLASARNLGIQVASGDFISFVDDDDLIHPDYISLALPYLIQQPDSVVCYSDSRSFDAFHSTTRRCVLNRYRGQSIEMLFCNYDALWGHPNINLYSSCAKIYPRALFKADVRFDEKQGYIGEDRLFLFQMIDYFDDFICLSGSPMYYYRPRVNSITNGYKPNITAKYLEVANRLFESCHGVFRREMQVYFDVLNMHLFNVCCADIYNPLSPDSFWTKTQRFTKYISSPLFRAALGSAALQYVPNVRKRMVLRALRLHMVLFVSLLLEHRYKHRLRGVH